MGQSETLYIQRSYYDNEISWARKSEYAYNPNGMLLYEKLYDWEDDQWTLYHEMTLQYDVTGMMTGGTFYSDGVTLPVTVSGTLENMEVTIVKDGVTYVKNHFSSCRAGWLASKRSQPVRQPYRRCRCRRVFTSLSSGQIRERQRLKSPKNK
jgi:hypothetical protein